MKIQLQNGLPYITATINYRDNLLEFQHVMLDTGSAGTLFCIDKLPIARWITDLI